MDYTPIEAYSAESFVENINHLMSDPGFLRILHSFTSLPGILQETGFDQVIKRLKNIKNVDEFQLIMHEVIDFNVKKTTDALTYSGMDNLPDHTGSIFVTNHRSTSLDAAYLNDILFSECRETVYSGAGKNIFETSWLGHLIRLNKGFVISRVIEDIDEKIADAIRLSSYINSLISRGHSVWIAQRPGRAKDGNDVTDSVVIAMLYKALENVSYEEWLHSAYLNPVSISWEIVPCDLLLASQQEGQDTTVEGAADLKNILYEIQAYKGRVHFSFCKRVIENSRSEIVRSIDREIQRSYRLWDANWYAYLKTAELTRREKQLITSRIDVSRAKMVLARSESLSNDASARLYEMYANPVKNALKHVDSLEMLFSTE